MKNLQTCVARQAFFAFPVVGYQAPKKTHPHHYLASFGTAIRRGQDVVRACEPPQVKEFVPDLITGHAD